MTSHQWKARKHHLNCLILRGQLAALKGRSAECAASPYAKLRQCTPKRQTYSLLHPKTAEFITSDENERLSLSMFYLGLQMFVGVINYYSSPNIFF